MKNINPKLIQLIGDVTIPLLGFLFWGWGLYFIVAFFLLDIVIKTFFTIKKSQLIINNQYFNQSKFKIKHLNLSILSIGSVTFIIILTHLVFYSVIPNFNLNKEIKTFLMYEEFGIPQLVLLIPLLYFGGNLQFKREFVSIKAYLHYPFMKLWNHFFKSQLFIFVGIILGFTLSKLTVIKEWVYTIFLLLFYVIHFLNSNKEVFKKK